MGSPVSVPQVGINLIPANVVDAFADRRDLLIGYVASGGSADGSLVQDIATMTLIELVDTFGTGELFHRIKYWRSGNGGYSPIDVLPIVASEPVTSSGDLTVTGTASEDGMLTVNLFDSNSFSYQVPVSLDDTADDVAAAINTVMDGQIDKPFFNSVLLGVVTIDGVDPNDFLTFERMEVVGSVPGITVTVTQQSGGSNTNVLDATLFDPLSGIRYTGVSWPQYMEPDIGLLKTFLEGRFNSPNGVFDGVGFMGTARASVDVAGLASFLNTQVLVVGGNDIDDTDFLPIIVQPADWTMAYFQGVRARRLTPGAPTADVIVTTNGPLDATGGPALASLPYFNTPLDQTPITPPSNLYTFQEMTMLRDSGVTVFGVNSEQTAMIAGPVVTTWITDASGNENPSFKFLNYVDTGSACREIFDRTIRSVFSQSRLTEGDLLPGRSIANEDSIRAEFLRIYRRLSEVALTQAGPDGEAFFADNLIVTVDLVTRTVTAAGPLPIVTQLGILIYNMQLAFTTDQNGTQIIF